MKLFIFTQLHILYFKVVNKNQKLDLESKGSSLGIDLELIWSGVVLLLDQVLTIDI